MPSNVVHGAAEAAKRILIIEDDAVVARLYQNRLRKEGYRVDIAAEGQEGFFSILKDKPDGVLLDLMLPNMDGIQILKKTRAQKQFEAIPIIVFSNSYINGMLDEAVSAGATRVFNKSDPATTQNIVAGFMDAFFPMRARELRAAASAAPPQVESVVPMDATGGVNGGTMMYQRAAPPPPAPAPAPTSAPANGNGYARPAFVAPTPRFGAIPAPRAPMLNANGAAGPVRPPTAPTPPPPAPVAAAAPPIPPPPPAPAVEPQFNGGGLRISGASLPPQTLAPPAAAPAPAAVQSAVPLPPPQATPEAIPAPSRPANSEAGGTIFISKNGPLLPASSRAPGRVVPPTDTAFVPVTDEVIAMQQEFVKVFFESGPETMAGIRKSMRAYSKEPSTPPGQAQLNGFYRKVHSLTGAAGMASLESIGNFSACLEAYLRELLTNPVSFQPSTLRTLANAVDLMGYMFDLGPSAHVEIPIEPVVIVVDDDVISRRAVTFGLEKAGLKAMGTADPHHALDEMAKKFYELIFLDVDMPDMDGFELCTRIRHMPDYLQTPVVFITGMTDFQTRAKSITSGGNDFISKPLCFMELAVKALTFVLKGRLTGHGELDKS